MNLPGPAPRPCYALSLKQPWATLLVHGLKTVEIRTWPTRHRGRVLIHAARDPDDRPEAQQLVPPQLAEAVQLRGGIIGAGDLTGCIAYRSPAAFAIDQPRHLNDPSWFQGRLMYGFTFANLTVLPFRRRPGQTRFFLVPPDDPAAGGP